MRPATAPATIAERNDPASTFRRAAAVLVALSAVLPIAAPHRGVASNTDPPATQAPDPGSPFWRSALIHGTYPQRSWAAAATRGLETVWSASVGVGFSAPAVADGLLWTVGHVGTEDVVICRDATTGAELWSRRYPVGTGEYPGPLATPAVADGRLYVQSRWGDLRCYRAHDGGPLWERRLARELGARFQTYEMGSSPVPTGDGLIVALNDVVALLDAASGATRWATKLPRPIDKSAGSYATPVPFSADEGEMLAFLGEDRLFVIAAGSGSVLASHPWLESTAPFANVADPVARAGLIVVSNGYRDECAALRFAGSALVVQWTSPMPRCHVSTPVVVGEYLYGIDGKVGAPSSLVCLRLETGELLWRERVPNGALVATVDELVLLGENGRLLVAAADPAGYRELLAHDVAAGKYWAPPVLWRDMIYCRSAAGALSCLRPAERPSGPLGRLLPRPRP